MNILIAPNSMKESLSAFQFADAIERAFKQSSPIFNIRKLPIADGGDFTGVILAQLYNAQKIEVEVYNPYRKKIKAPIYIKDKLAIIEMADASGLKVCDRATLNPLEASSYGSGQLIKKAIELGCDKIYLGVGGSATVDAGMGMMTALGFIFLDENKQELVGSGQNLLKVKSFIAPKHTENIEITIISDVDNPYSGNNGAVRVFAPQKGATPAMLDILDQGFENWKSILPKQDVNLSGMGAAGGLALPLTIFFNAHIVAGADFIFELLSMDKHIQWSDIVITGEGRIDNQTNNSKAPGVLALRAKKYNKPIIALAGAVQFNKENNFNGTFSVINQPMTLENAMKKSEKLVFETAFELSKLILKLKTDE